MADVKTLNQWTLAQLQPLGGHVHDGMVPSSVSTMANGGVEPYMAVWSQPLREHDEQSLSYCHPETAGGLTITVAGHSPGTVRSFSQAVVRALHRVQAPGGGEFLHSQPYAPIMYDETATPGRYYQPITFTFQQP